MAGVPVRPTAQTSRRQSLGIPKREQQRSCSSSRGWLRADPTRRRQEALQQRARALGEGGSARSPAPRQSSQPHQAVQVQRTVGQVQGRRTQVRPDSTRRSDFRFRVPGGPGRGRCLGLGGPRRQRAGEIGSREKRARLRQEEGL